MKKAVTAAVLTAVITAIGMGAGIGLGRISREVFSFEKRAKVVLDAGHGAPDGGAVGYSGTMEKDVNLDITLKLREILESRGIDVILTRSDDNGIYDESAETIHEMKVSDMKKRRDIINNSDADLAVSIHMNAFTDTSARGLHIFYSRNHPEIQPLAEAIQTAVSDITGAETHEVKTASDTLYLMKDPNVPIILAECGFISNPDEEKLLNTDEYKAKIAFAIADCIVKAYDSETK